MADSCKACDWIAKAETKSNLVWANELWILRHSAPPAPALGWLTLHSRRHISGAIEFTDAEAADFGGLVKDISQALVDATGALRVYFASMSEGTPHFHVHFVPRYEGGPKGWDAFADMARARDGLTNVDESKVPGVIAFVRDRLEKR